MATFEFSIEDLKKIAKEHPEAVKEDAETIRFCSYMQVKGKEPEPEEVKCGGCNWNVDRFFVEANTREEAVKLIVSGDAGLCGECFSNMLSEEKQPTMQIYVDALPPGTGWAEHLEDDLARLLKKYGLKARVEDSVTGNTTTTEGEGLESAD